VEHETRSSGDEWWVAGPAFRRVTPPVWPFFFRGLVPVLGLVLLAWFSVTRFANHWIEAQVTENLAEALDASGHEWTDLRVSGQQAFLSGRLPQSGAGDAALQVARSATCPTWLGPKVCATSVQGDFTAPAVETTGATSPAPPAIETLRAEAAAACESTLASLLGNERIEFASGSANIMPSTAPLLDRLADAVRACPGTVRVEGHTDSTGDPESNRTLSQARADAVRAALGARAVPLERLVAVGFGQANPIAGNDTAAGRARNRRIEFRVQSPTN